MELAVYQYKKDSLVEVAKEVYNIESLNNFNEPLVHQVITSVQKKLRSGTRATKNRSAASGGGKKPWRQKGTGRARAGTIRSPIWVGGGHTFARQPYDYTKGCKINKKMYRQAINGIMRKHIENGTLKIIDEIKVDKISTKSMSKYLNDIGFDRGLILVEEASLELYLSLRNLGNIYLCESYDVDALTLYVADQVLITKQALADYLGEEVL